MVGTIKKIAYVMLPVGIVALWFIIIFGALHAPDVVQRLYSGQSINVFAWSDSLDPDVLYDFEKETGIRVNLTHYESNEELFAKLYTANGAGYDLIMPSDYMLDNLRKHGLLQRLDHKKMDFISRLDSRLMGHFFDPHNHYSVPSEWSVVGIGYDRTVFLGGLPKNSWAMIFDPEYMPEKLVASGYARELCYIAARYLFGRVTQSLTPGQIDQIVELLRKQKPKVLAYSSARADLLVAAHNAQLAVIANIYLARSAQHVDNLDFDVPVEGGFLNIENFAVPSASNKIDLVYKLLNYLYKPEIVYQMALDAILLPATVKEQKRLALVPAFSKMLNIPKKQFGKLSFFTDVLTEAQVNEIWVRLKAP
jgi:spermidine/putrescine transport system substrate-binding protein